MAPNTVPWPIVETRWGDRTPITEPARFYRVLEVSPVPARGRLISSSGIRSLSVLEISFLLWLQNISISPTFDVDLHKLVYETIDPWGRSTVASGTLALPRNPGKDLPLVSYQHGTIVEKTDVPSTGQGVEVFVGVVYATTGYAAVMPDYLGMGDSPGLHPYHHARSEATASVDLLRAARAYCGAHSVSLNGQLFLCGYSQGGHSTMALHRELERFHTNEFTITASTPMAGAYDLSGVMVDDFLSERPQPNPYYFAYMVAAYQAVYHVAPSLEAMLVAPYKTNLPPLLDGRSSAGAINAVMPAAPVKIFDPVFLADFRKNPDNPLRLALQDNDLWRWTPVAPMRVYHCQADQDVPFANAQAAIDSFHSRGATSNVELIVPLPDGNHATCLFPSLLEGMAWFETMADK
jgi:pimeloyl-ACP methyl ester carboxylesterase